MTHQASDKTQGLYDELAAILRKELRTTHEADALGLLDALLSHHCEDVLRYGAALMLHKRDFINHCFDPADQAHEFLLAAADLTAQED